MAHPSTRILSALVIASSGLALSAVPVIAAAQVAEQETAAATSPAGVTFEIAAQPLTSALMQFSQQGGVQVSMQGLRANGVQANALSGSYSIDAGLTTLLQGTGFTHSQTGSLTYTLQGPLAEGESPNAAAAPANEIAGAGMQEEVATESVTSIRRGGIEEIIVTARKREESSQDIPISITAISAEDIKTMGIRTMADMEGIVTGLNMGGGGNGVKKDNNPFIRGIGQRETKVTLDPGVGTYIDGIYIGRPSGGLFDVAAVESIEVLRGPQGTLFGRNATGGAISITLKKPGTEFSGKLNSNIGNYGRRDLSLSVDVPLFRDVVLSRVTLSSMESDGYFTNVVDNSKWGNDDRLSGIAQLRIQPIDDLTIDILGERTRIREQPRPQRCKFLRNPGYIRSFTGMLMDLNNASLGIPTFESKCRASEDLPQDRFESDLAAGVDYRNDAPGSASDLQPQARYWVDTSTLGGTVNWRIGDVGPISGLQFKSISAWRRTGQIADEDLDAVGGTYLLRVQPSMTETTQLSQELQLTGATFNDRLFFSTGVYVFGEETPRDELILSAGLTQGTGDIAGRPPEEFYTLALEPAKERLETDNKTWAWYGQLDFDITKQWQLSAGVRYTNENRWSRYSKNNVDTRSMVYGDITGTGGSQAAGTVFAYSTLPGMKPVLDWRFGTCMSPSQPGKLCTVTFFEDENTNPANFVLDLMMGDEMRRKDDAWTPMFSLKYKASDEVLQALGLNDAMAYFTYSEGFHSGGVTAGAPDDNGNGVGDPAEFEPEFVKNYEVGLKMQAWNHRVQANIAMFYMDYTDMQLSSTAISAVGIPIPYVSNVGKSVIQGIEAEFLVMPLPNWRIILNGGFTDADIKEWQEKQTALDFARRSGAVTYIDRSDEPMPRVPRVQAFFLTDYTFRLPNHGMITPSVAVRYSTELYNGFDRGSYCYTYGGVCDRGANRGFFDPPNDAVIVPEPGAEHALTSEKVIFLDARLTWASTDARMEVAIWGKNLTNVDDYMVAAIPLTDVNGATGLIYANPRTFGMTMTYNFGVQ